MEDLYNICSVDINCTYTTDEEFQYDTIFNTPGVSTDDRLGVDRWWCLSTRCDDGTARREAVPWASRWV